jgi:hypothetical protein
MTTFSGRIAQKAAYGDPNTNTFAVEANGTADFRGGLTVAGKLSFARKVVAASVSAASSAATTALVPRGYIEVYVSGVRCAIPYFTEKS